MHQHHDSLQAITLKVTAVTLFSILMLSGIANGQVLEWAERAGTGGPGGFDIGWSIDVDSAGNSYVGGRIGSNDGGSADFGPLSIPADTHSTPILAKYDPDGVAQWVFGLYAETADGYPSVAVDGDANVYMTGDFGMSLDFDPGSGTAILTSNGPCIGSICNPDIYLAKYDSDGNYQWAFAIGGGKNDSPQAIAVDDSYIYITGFFVESVDFDPGPGIATLTGPADTLNTFVAKYDQDGNFVWARSFFSNSKHQDSSGISVDGDGNVYVTGGFVGTVDFKPGPGTENLTSAGNVDIYLVKLNASGNFVWALGIGDSGADQARDVDVDSSGNAYITGAFNDTVFFDPRSGTSSLTSNGGSDAFIASYTPAGSLRWAYGFGDVGDDSGWGMSVDNSDEVHVSGDFEGTADFAPGSEVLELSSHTRDAFAARYDADGNLLGAANAGGRDAGATGFSIAADSAGSSLITGDFNRSCDFDPGPGTEILTAPTDRTDIFVWKLAPNSPPVCNLADPGTTECQGSTTMVALDGSGSSDPDGDMISYQWSSTCPDASFDDATSATPTLTLTSDAPCPLTCAVTLTVSDPGGLSDTCTALVTIEDTSPPTITCPADESYECLDEVPAADVSLVSAGDDCDPNLAITHVQDTDNGGSGCLGDPLIISRVYRATDACGNSADCTQTITVEDKTAPEVTCDVAVDQLWPPKHDLITVGLSASATDNCDDDPAFSVVVYADEDDEEQTGDGHHAPDARDIDLDTLRLRAERKGNADGRVYLIVVTATDECGNAASTCCIVTVPKSKSRKSRDSVALQAAVASAYWEANGAPPAGFVLVGDSVDIGPKQ